ncbi:MAG: class I adenylate-forming enzyme family protein [Chloroflexi bacterium]|nr:class I adenylate-forming enzyme family protein [Chloroflexota bacterium]
MIPIKYTKEQFEKLTRDGFFGEVIDYIDENAVKWPNKEAFVDSEKRLTFAQAKDKSDNLAMGFIEMGLKKDQIIVLQVPNVVEYYIVRSACAKAGLIGLFTMMYLRNKEIEFACKQSGATAIVITADFHDFNYYQMIQEIKPNLPELKYIFTIGTKVPDGTISLNELMNKPGKVDTKVFENTKLKAGEISEIKLTSGTTGIPKLTESYQVGSRQMINNLVNKFKVEHEDIFAALAPLTGGASGGAICKGISMIQGCKVVMLERFEAEDALKLIEKERVTFVTGVPTMMAKMIRHPNFDKYDHSSVRVFHSSGAYLPPGLAKETEEKLGCKIMNHYGAIDIGFATSTSVEDNLEARLSSVGKPMPDVTLKLLDEKGKEVPQGEVGEIFWASSHGGVSYFRDLEATRKRESSVGLTGSGDLGKVDENGNLYIVGRKKDMIIRGGQNIYPAEIESILITHPKIMNVAVVPMPDPVMGEKACAFVIPKEGQTLTFEELTTFMLEKKCAKYKLPERLEIVDNFPMSGDGQKVIKRELTDIVTRKLRSAGNNN